MYVNSNYNIIIIGIVLNFITCTINGKEIPVRNANAPQFKETREYFLGFVAESSV